MAEEINLIVNVEAGNGKKTVADVRKELDEAQKAATKTGDALKTGIETASNSAVNLKTQLRQMIQEMQGLDPSSARFKQLAKDAGNLKDKIGDISQKVNALSSDTKKIDALVGAGSAIAGGFQAASGAMALFGSNTEAVQKHIQNIIAVQGILNGVQQVGQFITTRGIIQDNVAAAAKATLAGVTVAYTAVQRALNAAMTANPIGLLITAFAALATGIGFLIANFEAVAGWIVNVGKSILSFFGIIEDTEAQQEERRAARAQANASRNRARLQEIEEERDARKEQFKQEQSALDLEIEALEAVGKSSYALRLQKAQNRLEDLKAELEHIGKVSESWTKYYEDQAVLSGQSREDFIKTLKGQGIDIESLVNQREALQKEVETEITRSEIEITKINYDETQKRIGNAKDEKDAKIDMIDEYQRALHQQQENEAAADALFLQRMEDRDLAETIAQEAQIDRDNAFNEEQNRIAEEQDQLKRDRQKQLANDTIGAAQSSVDFLNQINTLAFGRDMQRINAKLAAGERLTAAEEKQRRRQSAINKAFALAQIAIDTATAISGAVTQAQSVPYPANIAAIISGVTAVLANIAAAAGIIGGASGIPSGASGAAGDISEAVNETGDTIPNGRDLTGSTLLNAEPIKVFVTENDITNTQNSVNAIVQQATYG